MKTLYKSMLFVIFLTVSVISCTTEKTDLLLDDLQIVPSDVVLTKGETLKLELVFTPNDVEDKSVIWESSNSSVATVDADGVVMAGDAGTSVVTAISGGVMAVCNVTVNSGPVQSVVIDKTELTLEPGEVHQLSVTIAPEDADLSTLEWTSSDNSILSVDGNGMVTALKEGVAQVIVSASDAVSDTCKVSVVLKPSVGDFFYSDGTWSKNLDEAKTVVGVVYYVGDPSVNDRLLKKEHPECVNGLAMSIHEFKDFFQPQSREYMAHYGADNNNCYYIQDWISENHPEFQSILSVGVAMGDSGNLMLGYNNTNAMIAFNEDSDNSAWPLIPIQKLEAFRNDNPLPANTSGWYMPSSKELYLMTETDPFVNIFWALREGDNKEVINKSLAKIDGAALLGNSDEQSMNYWSSTEYKMYGTMTFMDFKIITSIPSGNPADVCDNSYRYVFAF